MSIANKMVRLYAPLNLSNVFVLFCFLFLFVFVVKCLSTFVARVCMALQIELELKVPRPDKGLGDNIKLAIQFPQFQSPSLMGTIT